DHRGGDGVEVPAAPVGQDRQGQRDHQDQRRPERAPDDRDRREAPQRDRRLAERRRGERRQDREPQGGRERRDDRDVYVPLQDTPGPERRLEQTRDVRGAEPSADRPEDRPLHPDRGRDQDDQPGQLLERSGDVREGESGDEPRQ